MSLTHLFNFRYFIENLKKSKSVLIIAMLILPTFSALMLLLANSESEAEIMSFASLNMFNYIFMYVIPIVLSTSLFEYVYKKNSADFIGAIPLSRKTIFVTNTVFGILVLILLQAITALITAFLSITLDSVIIFGSMIWDSFIYFSIAYIFVFVVCNLAVSFSGNTFATIAATMLILFLVPYTMMLGRGALYQENGYNSSEYEIENGIVTVYDRFNFTAPSLVFGSMAYGDSFEYNNISIIKMAVLSVVYFIIGIIIFNRKKYEMAEESFETTKMHLFIKMLTLTPFMSFVIMSEFVNDGLAMTFLVVTSAIYYFVFDIITKKRISLKVNLIGFICSFAIMFVLFTTVVPKLYLLSKREYSLANDIKSVTLVSLKSSRENAVYLNLKIEDKDMIKDILFNNSTSRDSKYGCPCTFTIDTKNGKRYFVSQYMYDILDDVVDKYGDELVNIDTSNYEAALSTVKVANSEITELRRCIDKDMENKTVKELFDIAFGKSEFYKINTASYTNHKLIYNDLSYAGYANTNEYAVNLINKATINNERGISYADMVYQQDFIDYIISVNPELSIEHLSNRNDTSNDTITYEPYIVSKYRDASRAYGADYYSNEKEFQNEMVLTMISDGVSLIPSDELKLHFSNHKDDIFDREKPYYVLRIEFNNTFWFYSNDIKDFYKLFAKTYNMNYLTDSSFKLNENV